MDLHATQPGSCSSSRVSDEKRYSVNKTTYVVVGESLCLVERRVAADHHRLESFEQNLVAERRAGQDPVAVHVAALEVHEIDFVDLVLPRRHRSRRLAGDGVGLG